MARLITDEASVREEGREKVVKSWETSGVLALYIAPVVLVFFWILLRKQRQNSKNRQLLEANLAAGLTQPASLHPVIDKELCIGCTSCVSACPEGDVLGIINDKAELINPTRCIGHGACAKACPMGGITLVFGTATRGVDIPMVDQNFQTNVPGIYLAGEIGGMGLIRNAMTQGVQAVEAICESIEKNSQDVLDLLIVGAGPAGIAASITAKHHGLRYKTIEQDSFGGTVSHYPRGKLVMTQAVALPGVGELKLGEIRKEELLKLWTDLRDKTGIEITYEEQLEKVENQNDHFVITTNKAQLTAQRILIAIGRRGTPRKLGAAGEDLSKVVYRLIDPEQYKGQHVLVVGGGDSAIEAAMAIAEQEGTTVILSYRSNAFGRAKELNRSRLQAMQDANTVEVLLNSKVKEITQDKVIIEQQEKILERANDAVIVNVGGVLPTGMLENMGIKIETKYGTA